MLDPLRGRPRQLGAEDARALAARCLAEHAERIRTRMTEGLIVSAGDHGAERIDGAHEGERDVTTAVVTRLGEIGRQFRTGRGDQRQTFGFGLRQHRRAGVMLQE